MTIRSIMTHVEPASAVPELKHLAHALALAEAFKAHLTALVFPTEVMIAEAESEQRDAQVTSQIHEASAKRGVACEVRGRSSFAYGFPDVFADHAKVNDLSVIGYRPGPTMAQRMLAFGAIFSSGRPALIVPDAAPAGALPQRVAIAWDATPASVRAVHNAMPFLLRAEETFVFSVTDDKELRRGESGAELTQLLARHGVQASFLPVHNKGGKVFDTLTKACTDNQVSLLVMGCLGHSPLYEMVFGSATHSLLDGRAPIAVLASA